MACLVAIAPLSSGFHVPGELSDVVLLDCVSAAVDSDLRGNMMQFDHARVGHCGTAVD